MKLTVELKGLDEAMRLFDPKTVNRAARFAINDAVRAGRTAADKEIRARWNVKRDKLKVELRNVKMATASDHTAIIQAKGRPISLTYFGAKETRTLSRGRVLVQDRKSGKIVKRSKAARGVSVKIRRGQSTRLPKAFIATTRNGYVGVFERVRGSRNRVGKEKLQNKAVITIASMFQQKRVQDATVRAALARWEARLPHHLDRFMK